MWYYVQWRKEYEHNNVYIFSYNTVNISVLEIVIKNCN